MAILNQEQLDVLLKHKHYYDLFSKTGSLVNFSAEVQNELLSIYRVADPAYTYNHRCPACVGSFLVNVYKTFKNQLPDG